MFEHREGWSNEKKEAHALHHIQSFLQAHLTGLADFGLPGFDETLLPAQEELYNDCGSTNISTTAARRDALRITQRFNEEQERAFNRIIEAVPDPDYIKPFFVQGSGGTGKTMLLQALFYDLTSKGHEVLCVAHTGVAAKLLPFGSTAHRAFHIPLAVEEDMRWNVDLESNEAAYLQHVDVVIWDEATMSHRRILQAVNLLMKDLHPEKDALLFVGVKFIFGGDWKQTLPIVTDVRGPAVVNYTMKGSDLWKNIELIHLQKNMRARADHPFADWIATVATGIANVDHNMRFEDQQVQLQYGKLVGSETDLITNVFGYSGFPEQKRKIFETSCILAVDNRTTFYVNHKVLKLLKADQRNYISVDEHDPSRGFAHLDPAVYHGETPSGMPLHELEVKKGAVVMLLRNINTQLGLVNGTRMIIDEMGDHVIWAKPLDRTSRTPNRWPLTRMMFMPTNVFSRQRSFIRTQFPIRLAFAITCNKAQGQAQDRRIYRNSDK